MNKIFIKIQFFLPCLLLVSFLLPLEVSRIILWVTFIFFLFDINLKNKINVKTKLILFYLSICLLSNFVNEGVGGLSIFFDKYYVLILLLLLTYSDKFINNIILKRKLVLKLSLVICSLLFLKSFINSFHYNDQNKLFYDSAILYNENLSFFKSIGFGGNNYFGSNLFSFLQPVYFIIILLIFYLLFSLKYDFKLILVLFLSILSLSKIIYIIIFILFLYFFDFRENKKMFLFIFFISLTFFILNPKFSELYNTLKNINNLSFTSYKTSTTIRLIIWKSYVSSFYDLNFINKLIGIGDVEAFNIIKQYLSMNKFNSYYNAHNQFLESLLRYGIIGLISFTLTLFYKMNRLNFIFIFIFVLFNLTESSLIRYHGMFVFYLCVFFTDRFFENLDSRNCNNINNCSSH